MKCAFVFPGQGSQSLGMLAELSKRFLTVQETFAEASVILGYDLWYLTQKGPLEVLNKTWHTQPALLAASVSIFRIWKQQGGEAPTLMVGHSLGEYSALVCAGVLDFQKTVNLVALRGKLMQEAVPEGTGAMCAITGLDNETIIKACEISSQGKVVAPASFNAPGQVVISGHKEAVNRAVTICKASGAKSVVSLPVSVPSHCMLMMPASHKLEAALYDFSFNPPVVPVVNNVDVRIETNPKLIRSALVRQLYSPVRWSEIVELIASKGITRLLEAGPGKILSNLTKRIVTSLPAIPINESTKLLSELKNNKEGINEF